MIHYCILKLKNEKEENSGFFSYFFSSKNITAEDIAKSYFSLDIKLKNLYPNVTIDFEKKNIFKSLNSKWYKCQNGHYYTLDEVGDIKNELSCPYCTLTDKAFGFVKYVFGY